MAVYNAPKVGLYNVGSYQVSGKPFITGSALSTNNKVQRISFPNVTKSVTVINGPAVDLPIQVHFQSGSDVTAFAAGENGSAGEKAISNTGDDVITFKHFVTLSNLGDSVTFNVKCKEIFISTPASAGTNVDYQVIADLTSIPTTSMYHLTGSGITDDGS